MFRDRRAKIPYGTKLPVSFAVADLELIRKRTFADARLLALGVVTGRRITLELSLDDIEELQGFVAAEANHSKDAELGKQLYRVFDHLQTFLDAYDDQAERP